MALLAIEEIGTLLRPYYPDPSPHLLERLSAYLDLLAKWNSRTNLTAIRDPREIVRRHFGESLFAAAHLPPCRSLLDLGSGAGFPGLPIALAKPDLQVVLAESKNKKASFLMEARRVLNIKVEIWAFRVELIQPEKLFDVVTLRAVDNMKLALELARNRLVDSGTIVQFVPSAEADIGDLPLPGDLGSALRFISGVPRGTISLHNKS